MQRRQMLGYGTKVLLNKRCVYDDSRSGSALWSTPVCQQYGAADIGDRRHRAVSRGAHAALERNRWTHAVVRATGEPIFAICRRIYCW